MASEKELNTWMARCYQLVDEKEELTQQLAEARALLKDTLDEWTHGQFHDTTLEERVCAFLARSKK